MKPDLKLGELNACYGLEEQPLSLALVTYRRVLGVGGRSCRVLGNHWTVSRISRGVSRVRPWSRSCWSWRIGRWPVGPGGSFRSSGGGGGSGGSGGGSSGGGGISFIVGWRLVK